MLNLMMMMII